MKDRMLHMIGNAHIDPVWLWQWPEGFEEIRATFRSALDRMKEYPDFHFTADSAAYYAWVEEVDPELFEEIRQRVAEGRWEVVGGWWVEPDCNIPSGESFVRHALVSQRFFRSRFGRPARMGSNVDPFGHSGGLPQLLRRAGLETYVFMRPGPHEKSLPAPLFRWRSLDGSEVLAARIPHEYCTPREQIDYHLDKVVSQLPPDWHEFICFYGVGNHGGGPTKANIDSIHRLDRADQAPHLVLSTLEGFFETAAAPAADRLPVVQDDLQHHAVGCYAAHSGIKRWNRRAEGHLYAAESWAVIANRVADVAYPAADFDRAWKNVLFNQFHDILAGTSIEPAYEQARDQLGESSSIAERALNLAVQSIARRIDVPETSAQPVVVFNPHPWPVATVVELEYGGFTAADALLDENGRSVPVQETQSYATASDWRKRICFEAELPPLGYRTFAVRRGAPRALEPAVRASTTTLENDRLRVAFDDATGRIVELVVRGDGSQPDRDLADPARGRAFVVDDTTDTWGHRALAYRDVVGEFETRRVELVESGPVRAIVRVVSTFGESTLTEDFVVASRSPMLEWRILLDWRERAKLLKLRAPTPIRDGVATYEIPYSIIVRPANGEEEPGQRWVDVSGTLPNGLAAGLVVLNDAKYGFDVIDGSIGVTGVRSPIYAHHDPALPLPGVRYQYQDIGFQRFTLGLVPHRGSWQDARVPRLAAELNVRPTTLLESPHAGDLPMVQSFVSVSSPDLVLGGLKHAEDGHDLVVRLVETHGRGGTARIVVPGGEFQAEVGPWQVRTWRVDAAGAAVEVNLLEDPIDAAGSVPGASGSAAEAPVHPRDGGESPVGEPDRPESEPPEVEPLGV